MQQGLQASPDVLDLLVPQAQQGSQAALEDQAGLGVQGQLDPGDSLALLEAVDSLGLAAARPVRTYPILHELIIYFQGQQEQQAHLDAQGSQVRRAQQGSLDHRVLLAEMEQQGIQDHGDSLALLEARDNLGSAEARLVSKFFLEVGQSMSHSIWT